MAGVRPTKKSKPKQEVPKELRDHRWKKGQSGNPGGRPKLFESLFTQAMAKVFKEIDPRTGDTNISLLARSTFETCKKQINKGKVDKSIAQLTVYMIDRVEGKPPQAITLKRDEDDVTNRSTSELEHYLKFGKWPEVATQESKPSA